MSSGEEVGRTVRVEEGNEVDEVVDELVVEDDIVRSVELTVKSKTLVSF